MRNTDYIDFNRDTVRTKTRKRIFFAVFAALFCGALIFTVLLALNDFSIEKFIGIEETGTSDLIEDESETEMNEEPAELFSDKDALGMLFLCSDGKEITFCDIISFSKAENSVKVKPVSPELMMTYGNRELTLNELFSSFGVPEAVSAFSEKGIEISRYISVTEPNFKALIQKLGNIKVYFPNDVDFTVDSIRYQYFSGTNEISSDALLSVMKNAFSGDSALSFQAQAVAGIIETYFTPEFFESDNGMFSQLINLINGNITAFDYAEYKNDIISFLSGNPDIIVLS
ncbi:MAG: hypothetical protein J1E34_00385 [Oscillospiraceae bacterium]|nr:hypothetical protein [Oscillospiraceae bacterium]